jgi:hypothetical protein
MPAIQGRTREQLRQHIGRAVGGLYVSAATAQGSADNNNLLDNTLVLGGADTQIGKWIRFTSGSNDTLTRRITDSSITSNVTTHTFMPAVGTRTASESYELWDGAYSPDHIDDFINQSILSATGWVYDPIENISLHGDGKQVRFDIPSNISMISKIEYRTKVSSTSIHTCGVTFDESTDNEMTQAVDGKDYKRGSSLKIATSAGDGSFITDSFTSINLRGYTHLEGWVKATTAIAAGDFNICLDDATCTCDGNDKETLAVPAASADTWTFFRIELANPEDDDAIVSVGIEYNANSGTNTVRFDELRVVHNDTAEWSTLDRRNWKIDKESRDLILVRDGHDAVGYALIKITGGDKPALMTADSDTTEIDEDYVIANTISLLLLSTSGGPATDPDAKRQLSAFWVDQAQRARRAFPMLANVRSVD